MDGKPTFAFFAPGENDGVPVGVFGFITRGEDTALAGFAHVGLVQAGAFVPRVERLVRSIKLDLAIVGPL